MFRREASDIASKQAQKRSKIEQIDKNRTKSLRSLTLAVNVASERAPHRRERRSLLLYLAAAVTMSLAYVGSPTLTQILGSTFGISLDFKFKILS